MLTKFIFKSVGGYITCYTAFQLGKLSGNELINRAQKREEIMINQEPVDPETWGQIRKETRDLISDLTSFIPFYQQKGDFASSHLISMSNLSLEKKGQLKNFQFHVDPKTLQLVKNNGPVLSKRDGSMIMLAGLTSLLTPGIFIGIQVLNFGFYGALGTYQGMYTPIKNYLLAKEKIKND